MSTTFYENFVKLLNVLNVLALPSEENRYSPVR